MLKVLDIPFIKSILRPLCAFVLLFLGIKLENLQRPVLTAIVFSQFRLPYFIKNTPMIDLKYDLGYEKFNHIRINSLKLTFPVEKIS